MINLKLLFVLLTVTVLIGCGGGEDSRPQPGADPEETEAAVVDSIISDLDKTSEDLQSMSEEVRSALDELLEEEN